MDLRDLKYAITGFYRLRFVKSVLMREICKEKVQFTLTFYLKQNKEVQLDLKHFEILIFSSLLPSLPPGKMLEE